MRMVHGRDDSNLRDDARHDTLVISEQKYTKRHENSREVDQGLARQAVDGGTARHDGGDKALSGCDVPGSGIGDLYSFFINGASVVAVAVALRAVKMAVLVRLVFARCVVAVVVDVVVVVHVLLVFALGRRVPFEDASQGVLVNVIVQAGADSGMVVAVVGQLLGEVAGVEPGVVVARRGGPGCGGIGRGEVGGPRLPVNVWVCARHRGRGSGGS